VSEAWHLIGSAENGTHETRETRSLGVSSKGKARKLCYK